MDFERYTDERVHMLKVRAMGQLLIIVFALVVLIKAPMFDIYCVIFNGSLISFWLGIFDEKIRIYS